MEKYFNTTGICYPEDHYMVNIESRLQKIEKLIGRGEYFMIHKARQYGKTTTLHMLADRLSEKYAVFSISFEGMGETVFEKEEAFIQRIYGLLDNALAYHETNGISEASRTTCTRMSHAESSDINLFTFSNFISEMCREADRPVILIIDEVDQASGHKLFLSFLGMLRDKYLKRKKQPTFQSVILSGVYDIKNLKLRVRPDSAHQYNSPWNIAADFTVDMSFHAADIEGMLKEYEQDHHTGMDLPFIAGLIYEYTSGYPFLVSRLCKIMDELLPERTDFTEGSSAWTKNGLLEAVRKLLTESNTLFDDMVKKICDNPELKNILYCILFKGESFPYNSDTHEIAVGLMFGFLDHVQGTVAIANRIFETRLYNWFLSEELLNSKIYKSAALDQNLFIRDGELDFEKILERFTEAFTDIYADAEESFIEENGRRFFLLYLKPIINGVGNYYIEARTRNMRRTDVIVDYLGKQYVCELKIWHGKEYNKRGQQQLVGYLNDYHLTKGYMLSFNFNKNKEIGVKRICLDGKLLIEAVV